MHLPNQIWVKNIFCKPIIFKPLNSRGSIRNILLTICVGCVWIEIYISYSKNKLLTKVLKVICWQKKWRVWIKIIYLKTIWLPGELLLEGLFVLLLQGLHVLSYVQTKDMVTVNISTKRLWLIIIPANKIHKIRK